MASASQQKYVDDIINSKGDLAKLLGIEETSTFAEIKKRYRKLAILVHPDKNPSPNAAKAFQLLQQTYDQAEAYLKLRDQQRKMGESEATHTTQAKDAPTSSAATHAAPPPQPQQQQQTAPQPQAAKASTDAFFFNCPKCNQRLRTFTAYVDMMFNCLACGHMFRIQMTGGAGTGTAPQAQAKSAEASPQPRKQPASPQKKTGPGFQQPPPPPRPPMGNDSFSSSSSSFDSSSDSDGGGRGSPSPQGAGVAPPHFSSEALQADMRRQQEEAKAKQQQRATKARDDLLNPTRQRGPWTCPKCTALNLRKKKRCGTCKTARPAAEGGDAPSGAATAEDVSPRSSAAASERIKIFAVGKTVEVRRRDGRWSECTVTGVDPSRQVYTVQGRDPNGDTWSKSVSFAGTREPQRTYRVGDHVETMQKGQWLPCRVEEVDHEAEVYYLTGGGGGGDGPSWSRGVAFASAALTLRPGSAPAADATANARGESKRKKVKKSWRCGSCSLMNKAGEERCAVCGERRTAAARGEAAAGAAAADAVSSSDEGGGFSERKAAARRGPLMDDSGEKEKEEKDRAENAKGRAQAEADAAAARAREDLEAQRLALERERQALEEQRAEEQRARERAEAEAAAREETARKEAEAAMEERVRAQVEAKAREMEARLQAEAEARLKSELEKQREDAMVKEQALAEKLRTLEGEKDAELRAARDAEQTAHAERERLAAALAALNQQRAADEATRVEQLTQQRRQAQLEVDRQTAAIDTLRCDLDSLRSIKAEDDSQAAGKIEALTSKLGALAREKLDKERAVSSLEAQVREAAASEKERMLALDAQRSAVDREARLVKMREAELKIREENERRKARDAERRVQQAVERERVKLQLEAGRQRVAQLQTSPRGDAGTAHHDPNAPNTTDVVLQAAIKNNVALEAKLDLYEQKMQQQAQQEAKLQQLLNETAEAYQTEISRVGETAETDLADIAKKLQATGAALHDEKEMAAYFASQIGSLNNEIETTQALLKDEQETAVMFASQIGALTKENEAVMQRLKDEQETAAFFAQQLLGMDGAAKGGVDVLKNFHTTTKELARAKEELEGEKECAEFFAAQLTEQRKQLRDAAAASTQMEQELASERECAEFFAHEVTTERKRRKELERAAADLEAQLQQLTEAATSNTATTTTTTADTDAIARKDTELAKLREEKDAELRALQAQIKALQAAPLQAAAAGAPAAATKATTAPKPAAAAAAVEGKKAADEEGEKKKKNDTAPPAVLAALPVLPEFDAAALESAVPPPATDAPPARGAAAAADDPFDSDTSDEDAMEAARIFKALPKVVYEAGSSPTGAAVGSGSGHTVPAGYAGAAYPPEPTPSTKASTILSNSSRATPTCPFPDSDDDEEIDVRSRGQAGDFWRTHADKDTDREGSYKDRDGRGLFRCPYCDVGFPDELSSIDLPATCPACRAPFLLLSSMLVMVCEERGVGGGGRAPAAGAAAAAPVAVDTGPSYEEMKKRILAEHGRQENLFMLGRVGGGADATASSLEADLNAAPSEKKTRAATSPTPASPTADDYEARKRRVLEAAKVGTGLRAYDTAAETARLRELEARVTSRCACGAGTRGRCILCDDDDESDGEITRAAAARAHEAERARQAAAPPPPPAAVEDDYEARKRRILEEAGLVAPTASAAPAAAPGKGPVMCDCGGAERGKCLFCDDD